ncbi:MAG: hypothetical protein Q4F79_12515 [Eubacteriales bacterium]|nr:hypothetical protein [Eubacteriales bacterium]
MSTDYAREDALQDAMNYIYKNNCDNVCVVTWKTGGDETFSTYSCGADGLSRAAAHLFAEFIVCMLRLNPKLLDGMFE